jgi:hypothetical protein
VKIEIYQEIIMKYKKRIYSLILLGLSCVYFNAFSSGVVNDTVTAEDINVRFTANTKQLHLDIRGGIRDTIEQELKSKTAAIINIWIKNKKALRILDHKHRIKTAGITIVLLTDISLPNPRKARHKRISLRWVTSAPAEEIRPPNSYNNNRVLGNKRAIKRLKKQKRQTNVAETSYYFK